MIDASCPQCGIVYHSEEAHIGKQLRCTKCGGAVPILPLANRTVAQQPPILSSTKGHRTNAAPTKRRRIYASAIAVAVIVVAVVSLAYLHHASASNKGTATVAEIAEPASSQSNDEVPPGQQTTTGRPAQPLEPRPTDYNSLPTGTRIDADVGSRGHGKLTVENGSDEDAVVRLSDLATDQTLRWFFVQAHSSVHVTKIPEGTYRLTFTTGLNWVQSEDTFGWNPSYFEFDRTFEYREPRDSEGVQYKTISVTLNPVLFGNIRTKAITRDEFFKGHRHVAMQQPEN